MRVALKGVYRSRKTLATGEQRDYYFLRGHGALKPLEDDEDEPFRPGTEAFMRSYNAAIARPVRARTAGTLQKVIDEYQRSQRYAGLAPRTKKDYDGALLKIAAKFGRHPLEVLQDKKIRKRFIDWRDEMAKRSLRQADLVFDVLRMLLDFAYDRGDIAVNHAVRPNKVYKSKRSDKLWLPEHVKAFKAVAEDDMLLALEVGRGTGQRRTDLLLLPWTAYVDDPDRPGCKRIRYSQRKKSRGIDMPVTASLQVVLDAAHAKRTCERILTNRGKPWSVTKTGGCSHFDHRWRKAILAAGLDGLHFHDLRGTACTELAEAGCTAPEIAALLGWEVETVEEMLRIYQAHTAALSNSAVEKLEKRRRERAET